MKNGRFGNWLREIQDWTLSRERYWGTPLPVWECDDCTHYEVIGSLKELNDLRFVTANGSANKKEHRKNYPLDEEGNLNLHRPYIDSIFLSCKKCGGQMQRVEEVMDVWFDSGSMPYAQWHYPFENKTELMGRVISNSFRLILLSKAWTRREVGFMSSLLCLLFWEEVLHTKCYFAWPSP